MPKKQKTHTTQWYEIKAAGKNQAEIQIYGNIGSSFWDEESVTARQLIDDLKTVQGRDLEVRINSVGGSVSDGIAIFNALRRHDGAVTTRVDAVAYSAASLIAMAGKDVVMADNGLLMIHAPKTDIYGNAKELRRRADVLDKYSDAMTGAYVRDGGPGRDEIDGWLKDGEDHYFTAAEAMDLGLIDGTTESIDIAACGDIDFGGFVPPTMAAQPAAHPQSKQEEAAMPRPTDKTQAGKPTAAKETAPVNISEIETAAAKKRDSEIKARNAEVIAVLNPHMHVEGMAELKDQVLADPTVTVAEARKLALEVVGRGYESLAQPAAHCIEDEQDKRIDGVTQIILARSNLKGPDGKRIQTRDNPWRGMTLMDISRDCLARAGIDARGMSKMDVVAAAFTQSTSDFGVLLEDAMHKALLAGYNSTPDTWSRFCSIGTVSDFRAHNRYMVGSLGNLEDLTELGEFRNKAIPDGRKESVSIGTVGNIINISRQAVINDDLGAFIGLSASLGRAGRRTIESKVYQTLALNSGMGPTMNDGLALFHATHKNIAGTGGPPSVATVESGVLAMAAQTDVSGNDFLDLSPTVWLGPKGLEVTARVLNASTSDPDVPAKTKNDNTPNPYQNYFADLVATPRLSGTAWYLFADPGEAPVIEVSFLDGEQQPFLDMQEGFSVDGARYKARLDFGVSGVGYEGAVYNAGA